jgi:hypothetical protein
MSASLLVVCPALPSARCHPGTARTLGSTGTGCAGARTVPNRAYSPELLVLLTYRPE